MVDGPNLYVYCNNDPINFVDLWGLCEEPTWKVVWRRWQLIGKAITRGEWKELWQDIKKQISETDRLDFAIQIGLIGTSSGISTRHIVYRQGTFPGKSMIKGSKWAPENPLTTPNYAQKYGLPAENSGKPDWVVKGRVQGEYTSGSAPAGHNASQNTGGATEIIPHDPSSVQLEWFHMPE
jgi:hypothetical protein